MQLQVSSNPFYLICFWVVCRSSIFVRTWCPASCSLIYAVKETVHILFVVPRVLHVNLNGLLTAIRITKMVTIFSFKQRSCSSPRSQQWELFWCYGVQLSKTACRSTHDYCRLHLPFGMKADSKSHAMTFDVQAPFDRLEYYSRCGLYLPYEQLCWISACNHVSASEC
jgi:hypothetical protein